MIEKRIPLRQCLGCREMLPKHELIRIVRSPDGVVSTDSSYKASGRGAYICKKETCFVKIRKSKAIERAFKTSLPSELFEELETIVFEDSKCKQSGC